MLLRDYRSATDARENLHEQVGENWLVPSVNRRYKTVRRAASLPPDGEWERHGRSSDKHDQSDYQTQPMHIVENIRGGGYISIIQPSPCVSFNLNIISFCLCLNFIRLFTFWLLPYFFEELTQWGPLINCRVKCILQCLSSYFIAAQSWFSARLSIWWSRAHHCQFQAIKLYVLSFLGTSLCAGHSH